jgi:hypothetical protein
MKERSANEDFGVVGVRHGGQQFGRVGVAHRASGGDVGSGSVVGSFPQVKAGSANWQFALRYQPPHCRKRGHIAGSPGFIDGRTIEATQTASLRYPGQRVESAQIETHKI